MRVLIDRLLALARLERPDVSEVREVNVEDVAADAITHVRAARGGDTSLVCAGQVVVFADPAELSEALENVLDNAVKYGRQSPVSVRVEAVGDEAIIRVSDGGAGIPDSERARLLERFFRGDDRAEIVGTGLGLAIAERAISRCSGRIALEESKPGRTIFNMTIPIAPARAPAIVPLPCNAAHRITFTYSGSPVYAITQVRSAVPRIGQRPTCRRKALRSRSKLRPPSSAKYRTSPALEH